MLLEGGQATLLDVDHGTYPFVTSSNPTAGGACTGSGIPPTRIDRVIAVVKAYATRVGSGPFPTELHDADGEKLRTDGAEFGTTTGRPRRCGWYDAPVARYAARVNGVTDFVLTKLDVLTGWERIPVCVAYEVEGVRHDEMPMTQTDFHHAEPVYEHLDGWDEDITGARTLADLPKTAQAYVAGARGHVRCADLGHRRRPGAGPDRGDPLAPRLSGTVTWSARSTRRATALPCTTDTRRKVAGFRHRRTSQESPCRAAASPAPPSPSSPSPACVGALSGTPRRRRRCSAGRGLHGQPGAVQRRTRTSPTTRTPRPRCRRRSTRGPADQPRRQRLPARRLGQRRDRDRQARVGPDRHYVFNRHDDRFEQVMAYYWVTQAQLYLQSLGFGGANGDLRPVNAESQDVRINQYGARQLVLRGTRSDLLTFGKGGVDDAEDAEVIVHEYGHAVHDAQVPGFGSSEEAGSIGEAFGDYLAVSVGLWAAGPERLGGQDPAGLRRRLGLTSPTPRRCRTACAGSTATKTVADVEGEVHADGEIWSRALWDIRTALGDTDRQPDHHQRAVRVQGRHQLRGRGDDHRAARRRPCTAPSAADRGDGRLPRPRHPLAFGA